MTEGVISNDLYQVARTELNEQVGFAIGNAGSTYWDAVLPSWALDDLIDTLVASQSADRTSVTRGTHFQIVRDGVDRLSDIRWLGLQGIGSLFQYEDTQVQKLIDVLQQLQASFATTYEIDLDTSETSWRAFETNVRKVVHAPEDVGAAPTVHGHAIADVAGLQAALDAVPTSTDLRAKSGIVYVDDYPRQGAEAYDAPRIQRALDYAITNGYGEVRFGPHPYLMDATVQIGVVSGLRLTGTRGRTIFRRDPNHVGITTPAFRIANTTGQVTEYIAFEGLTFVGGIANINALGDGRARSEGTTTQSEGGVTIQWADGRLDAAINVEGDMCVYWNVNGDQPNPYGVTRNILVRDCDFIGMRGLPVFFRGVRGYCRVESSHIKRSLDPGWVYCESAQFINNRSDYSMDNGCSLSRGCYEALAIGNSIYKPWFNGVWVSGFEQAQPTTETISPKPSYGPVMAVVADNVIRQPGEHGIRASDCAGRVTITGNTMLSVSLPAISVKDTASGIGILVSPYRESENLIPVAVTITGNTIDNTANGGIYCYAARALTITGNTLRSCGSTTNPDGTARATGVNSRFGITYGTGTAITGGINVTAVVTGNLIVDNRAEKGTYYPIYFPSGGYKLVAENGAFGPTQPITVGANAT